MSNKSKDVKGVKIMKKKKEVKTYLMTENRCRACNKIIYGLNVCNCIKSEPQKLLWDKEKRKRKNQK
jgi:hypothetical protein